MPVGSGQPALATEPSPEPAGRPLSRRARRLRTHDRAPLPADPEVDAAAPAHAATIGTDDDSFPLWPANQPGGPTQPGGAAVEGTDPGGTGGSTAVAAPPATGADNETTEVAWPTPRMRAGRQWVAPLPPARPVRRRSRRPRPPALGLSALLLLALIAGFVAWVNADAFWLAVGHRQAGTATVTNCSGHGLGTRCTGTFAADSGGFSTTRVALSALPQEARHAGATVRAAMVSAKGRAAYAGAPGRLVVRWLIGLVLVLLCGLGIAWATGSWQLASRRARAGAVATSLGAPLVLFVGILAAAW